MYPFHETLEKFFRKNFHDEIQRLPNDSNSDHFSLPASKTLSFQTYPGASDNQDARKRSISSVNGQTFAITSHQFSRSAPSLYLPPSTTPGDLSAPRSPLQRNLAHLVRYGMNGISSAPVERSIDLSESRSQSPPNNESGSFVNVVPAMPTVLREVPLTPSRGRFSRFGSILRKTERGS